MSFARTALRAPRHIQTCHRIFCRGYSQEAAKQGQDVRLRFGPSPTGYLHLGGLRTALFNYLLAKKHHGQFLLRIEDTDQNRLVEGAEQGLIETLRALGLDYDEGPQRGGPCAPYTQSQRLDIYKDHIEHLIEHGRAYPCFCSQDRLDDVRKRYKEARKLQSYDGHCKQYSIEEARQMRQEGKPHTVRFKNGPQVQPAAFTDLVYGQVGSKTVKAPRDDFILVKSDGFPTYHFANVVDDHAMKITHVMRGEEWIPSTPKHFALYRSFGWNPPQFAHMPILVSSGGQKMSKRDGDVHVIQYIADGWEPEAILNYVALLSASWDKAVRKDGSPVEDQVMTLDELVDNFAIENLNRHRSTIFAGKLAYLNRKHLERKTATPEGLKAVVARIQPALAAAWPDASHRTSDLDFVQRLFDLLRDRIDKLSDLPNLAELNFLLQRPDYVNDASIKMMSRTTKDDYSVATQTTAIRLKALAEPLTADAIRTMLDDIKQESGLGGKQFMVPLRHALTATKSGPDVPSLIAVLGKDETLSRLSAAGDFMAGFQPAQA